MKTIIHKAGDRGHANHGWLNAHHSFSFANYYDPSKVHFGILRVFNDDEIAAGMGFGTHPHDNMEIITIVQEGELQHKDSMGHTSIIRPGEVQVMSAGTGIYHSEANHSKSDMLKLFQIWLFPRQKNVEPRYDQKKFDPAGRKNKFQVVVSPEQGTDATWIHQDAWFCLSDMDAGTSLEYQIKKAGNGVYLFVIEGEVDVNGEKMERRDASGITETESFGIKANKDSKLLLIDLPME